MNVKQKILIADDSEINRALLMEILGDGYEYLEAENGVRAVELLREHTDIALVLLDIMMPQMDGFDVLKVMRCYSWLDEIPVIMISAAKDTANIERAYDLGVADYMRRPFERVMVLRQVQNVLMLYAKQKRLTRLVTDQVYEKEHNSVLMISILSHVVEFRNSESGLHVLHIRTLTDLLLHQLAGKTDRYQLDESDISLISTASALHDLGKIVIPTEILNKPGRLTAEAGEKFAGLKVWDANKVILEHIKESGHLMGVQHITHQYPHCWRCHHPIIFRATEQWFCSIDAFKEDVYKAIDSVHWQPAWGHDRMAGMVRDRSDWCISRQRVWGVPIPVFYCKKCGKYYITDASIKAVSDLFRKEGSDAWYKYDANDILPKTEVCECGASDWEKDPDIMDVWFDSGSTWSAVCRERPELRWPVDMYMEGADQFRGWFQSSLLTSVATQGVAPYREVLCHGWVVDAQGKQMHKSAGNGMEPSEIIRDYGADIIRLWVASSDYTVDVRAGKEIFRQLSEAYRKMRNTARFMLGNISDFDPAKDMVDDDQLFEIDRWALEACNKLTATMRDAYEHYDFSRAYHALYNFCVIDMSNFYMDVIKDRLYCADDHARRCAQTALYRILVDFTKLLAPILCFTSQEIWSYIPKLDGMKDYVVFEQMPEAKAAADEAFEAKWDRIMAIRDDVKKVLEQARADKVIGSALEAGLTLYCSKEVYDFLNAIPMDELADLFIVSHVDLVEGEGGVKGLVEGLGVSAAHAAGNKCLRCWKYETTVGEDGLCPRCAKVLKQ